jgi:TolB-like protein
VRLRPTAILLALLPALAAAAPPPRAGAPKRLKVAVMEVKVLYGDPQLEALLSEVALTEAATFRGFDTIGRSDIQALLGLEQQRQLLGCSEDASCLAEIGGAIGVDYLLVGTLGRIGTLLRLDLKLVDGKHARVVGRVGTTLGGKAEELVVATQNGVRGLLHELSPADPVIVRTSGPARWPAWVALGAGGATLAAGVVTTVLAASEYRALKDAQAEVGYAAAYDDRSAKVRKLALLSDILVPAGAVVTLGGGWLWWRSRPAPAVQVQVSAGPAGAGLLLSLGF